MIAETRNVDAGDLAGLEHRKALGDFDGVAIDEYLDGIFGFVEMNPGTGERGPRWEIWRGIGGCRSFWVLELRRGSDGSGYGKLGSQNPRRSVQNGGFQGSRSYQP